ncbi:uncharacterized protein LOC126678293 [Mercurialis annua]|uniref:uncharacterized protein LOC126678293 n=1 Tax=Mercurialis annua TaxID=3986 RepID=UPI00215FE99C|nr:uncharacterized protein LOC126678293 [Mercurialis annua]
MKIKMLHSTPYYVQANRQAEATNKAIKLIVQKMIEENPRQWHVLLSEAVWASRTSQKSATGTSPFRMVYGYDAMLPMELTVMPTRRLYQNRLSKDDYFDKMVIDSLDLDEERLAALDHLEAQKRRVERAYNKRVKPKTFAIGDMVWKAILPIGHKDKRLAANCCCNKQRAAANVQQQHPSTLLHTAAVVQQNRIATMAVSSPKIDPKTWVKNLEMKFQI